MLVIKDMEARRLHGIEKYGVPVQPGNGRDALIDLYQELLDACVYIRQELEKQSIYRKLVEDVRAYVLHHGVLLGECVAWNDLKRLTGVEQPAEERGK